MKTLRWIGLLFMTTAGAMLVLLGESFLVRDNFSFYGFLSLGMGCFMIGLALGNY